MVNIAVNRGFILCDFLYEKRKMLFRSKKSIAKFKNSQSMRKICVLRSDLSLFVKQRRAHKRSTAVLGPFISS